MDTKVLNQFKQMREQLVTEFKAKKAEVVAMAAELIALGIIQPEKPADTTPANNTPAATVQTVKGGSREEKILKALSKGPLTEKRIKEIADLSGINVLLNDMVKAGKLTKSNDRPAMFGVK